jgi:ATP-dependent DNA ligase
MLPGPFQNTIFNRAKPLKSSLFIRPMHPKTEIRPTREAVEKILQAGWIGQLKIHGHRAQIHLSVDASDPILAYNRQGQLHSKEIPEKIVTELHRYFSPTTGWNVIDAEWLKDEDKVFVFDFIKKDGELLNRLTYSERWKLLPRAFISPHLQTLGIVTNLEQCLEVLQRREDRLEGLVFKSSSPGFEDSSIIRCRQLKSSR